MITIDDFKKENVVLATSLDYNAPQYVTRSKGDGKMLRRYARRKIKQKDKEIINEEKRGDYNSDK